MGYIKEPEGIDFIVEPSILTEKDRLKISKIIAEYKMQGGKPDKIQTSLPHERDLISSRKKKVLA